MTDVGVRQTAWVLFNRRGGVVASGESPSVLEAWQAAMVYLDGVLDWSKASDRDVELANQRPEPDATAGEWRFECGWRIRVAAPGWPAEKSPGDPRPGRL